MVKLVIVIVITVAVVSTILLWACCTIAGKCSRREEGRHLKRCPVCKRIPEISYSCGEYFIQGKDPECPCCGTAFTEMHTSIESEINAWNRRAENENL